MIILDTNILSELMKTNPDSNVLVWAGTQWEQAVTTTSICCAEIYFGISNLPNGKRKNNLTQAFKTILDHHMDHILGFDQPSAEAYGFLGARLRSRGKTVGQRDTMIAAITWVNQGTLVTRNAKHFNDCGIQIVDPFIRLST